MTIENWDLLRGEIPSTLFILMLLVIFFNGIWAGGGGGA